MTPGILPHHTTVVHSCNVGMFQRCISSAQEIRTIRSCIHLTTTVTTMSDTLARLRQELGGEFVGMVNGYYRFILNKVTVDIHPFHPPSPSHIRCLVKEAKHNNWNYIRPGCQYPIPKEDQWLLVNTDCVYTTRMDIHSPYDLVAGKKWAIQNLFEKPNKNVLSFFHRFLLFCLSGGGYVGNG